jgi:hypothetical protein
MILGRPIHPDGMKRAGGYLWTWRLEQSQPAAPPLVYELRSI